MRPNIPNTEWLRVLLTGRSGSTKTRTAYSACLDARFGRVLGLDAKGQTRSIRNYKPKVGLEIITLESVADVTKVFRWLKGGQKATDPFVAELARMGLELKPPYKTLIPDGWSEIQRWVVANATQSTGKAPGEPLSSADRQDYGQILAQTLKIVSDFYELPMHVIGTVLEQERQQGENGPIVFRHQLVGQARDQLSSYPEIVGRLVHIEKVSAKITQHPTIKDLITEDTSSICFFKPSNSHEAKDQTGSLGQMMVEPTMAKMLDLIEG